MNYATFLKAFDVQDSKVFFPYEWFTSIDKLDHTELPPFGPAWFSSLKNDSVLNDGLKTPEENYAAVQQSWTDQGMTTFKDYLVYYNNLDCGPFVEAVENLQKYYFDRHIDMFKVSISLPGLARQMLFECGRQAGTSFSLFDESNKDFYHTIKGNIIGGPSITFNRYHKTGETFIRGNPDKNVKQLSDSMPMRFIFGLLVKTCPVDHLYAARQKMISNQKKETGIILCMSGWISLRKRKDLKSNTN